MENLETLYKKFLEVPDHASEKVAILDHNINHTNVNGNGKIQSLKFFHQYYFWVEKTDKWKCNYTIPRDNSLCMSCSWTSASRKRLGSHK